MRRLAIDPGFSTGWAYFKEDTWIASGVMPDDELGAAIKIWLSFRADKVIIERVPGLGLGPHALRLAATVASLETAFPEAIWILPGQWKPVSGTWPLPSGLDPRTTHERDAIRMVLFDLHRTSSRTR